MKIYQMNITQLKQTSEANDNTHPNKVTIDKV